MGNLTSHPWVHKLNTWEMLILASNPSAGPIRSLSRLRLIPTPLGCLPCQHHSSPGGGAAHWLPCPCPVQRPLTTSAGQLCVPVCGSKTRSRPFMLRGVSQPLPAAFPPHSSSLRSRNRLQGFSRTAVTPCHTLGGLKGRKCTVSQRCGPGVRGQGVGGAVPSRGLEGQSAPSLCPGSWSLAGRQFCVPRSIDASLPPPHHLSCCPRTPSSLRQTPVTGLGARPKSRGISSPYPQLIASAETLSPNELTFRGSKWM